MSVFKKIKRFPQEVMVMSRSGYEVAIHVYNGTEGIVD